MLNFIEVKRAVEIPLSIKGDLIMEYNRGIVVQDVNDLVC